MAYRYLKLVSYIIADIDGIDIKPRYEMKLDKSKNIPSEKMSTHCDFLVLLQYASSGKSSRAGREGSRFLIARSIQAENGGFLLSTKVFKFTIFP